MTTLYRASFLFWGTTIQAHQLINSRGDKNLAKGGKCSTPQMKPCLCALCPTPWVMMIHHKHSLNLPVILESSSETLGGLQLNPVTRLDGVQIQLCYLGHWSRKAVWVWWWWCMLWYSPPSQPPPHTSSTNRAQSQEHFQLGVFHLAKPDFPTLQA